MRYSDQIFDKARIVNCALMAKIHTVEWTPAILAHPALQIGMSANWWGIVGETLTKAVGRISKTNETISGIPGSGVDHQGIPYSLTEEFVSVYRMHSLIPGESKSSHWQLHTLTKIRQHCTLRSCQWSTHRYRSNGGCYLQQVTRPHQSWCHFRRRFLLLRHQLSRRHHEQQLLDRHAASQYTRWPGPRHGHSGHLARP